MKVIEGGFGKPEEKEEQPLGSDVFQSYADMLSEMEEEENYVEPVVLAIVAWPGVPCLIGSNTKDSAYVNAVLDFSKHEVLNCIATKEAVEAGIFEEEDDDTIH